MEKDHRLLRLWQAIFPGVRFGGTVSEEMKVALKAAVQKLRNEQRWLINQRYYKGESVEEIAKKFPRQDGGKGVHRGTVNQRTQVALRNLRHSPLLEPLAAAVGPLKTGAEWAQMLRERAETIAADIERTHLTIPLTAGRATLFILKSLSK